MENNSKTNPKINLYKNIGNIYRSKLDYKKALSYFEQSLAIYLSQDKTTLEEIASTNYQIAEIYYLINDYEKSLEIINLNKENAYAEDQILYYELLAFINHIQGNTSNAKQNYQNAINLTIAISEANNIDIATVYLNYSLYLISANEFSEAMENLEKAFNIISLSQPMHGVVLAEFYRIKGYLLINKPIETKNIKSFKEQKQQNLTLAINSFKNGLTALKFPKHYTLDSIQSSGEFLSLMGCIELLKLIGDNYTELSITKQGDQQKAHSDLLSMAIENYKIASLLIQKARKEISSDESKIQLTELEYSTFQKMIQTSFSAYFSTKNPEFIELAFQSAERIKSSSVFDKISDQLALENSLVPDSLIQLEKKLNSTISIFSEKLFDENNKEHPDSMQISVYTTQIFEATRKREELNRLMESEYGDYYDLKYSESRLTVKEIQQKLKEDEIILEFALIETDSLTELYTFLISGNNLDFRKQEVGTNFSKSIETMFYFMSSDKYMFTKNEDSKRFCMSANQLYSHLIFPFRNEIYNKNLIIIPDGKLNYIAFDALLGELPDTTKNIQFNQLKYLIRDYNISYANSANLLFTKNDQSKKFRNRVIAFAPEYQTESFELENQKLTLFPLAGVQKEVDLISKIIDTKVFKGKNATETNFRENIENYDILHLAMHAFINDSLPAFSRLAFTQDTFTNSNQDGWINTADIYNLDLDAHLTVLSACNTGTGQLKKGEGIMSLARGFLYAGCPSIVMSLWEVEDQTGSVIMNSFYKNLKKGKTKGEALRMAKLEYLESANSRQAHPHYWLGYICIGDNSPLYRSYDFYFFILLIVALSGIVVDQFLRIKKARRKRAS